MSIPIRPYCNLSLCDDSRLLRHACLITRDEAEEEDIHRRTVLLNFLEGECQKKKSENALSALKVLKGLDNEMGCSALTDFELRDRLWTLAHRCGDFDAVVMSVCYSAWCYPVTALPTAPPTVSQLIREVISENTYVEKCDFGLMTFVFDEERDVVHPYLTLCAFGKSAAGLRDKASFAGIEPREYLELRDGDDARKELASYTLCRPASSFELFGPISPLVGSLKMLEWLSRSDMKALWSSISEA